MHCVAFHDSAWRHHRGSPWYRDDIGVPEYLYELRTNGYQLLTFNVFPGLTVIHANPLGFDFLANEFTAQVPDLQGAIK